MKGVVQVGTARAAVKVQGKIVEGREGMGEECRDENAAHWRKLAGASHIGIGCHVDPVPAKPISSLVQTASPEHA